MQLSLTINNILIPLPDGISLPLVLRNPLMCLDGNFPGSFVFNFALPATDQLRAAVGQAHRPQLASRATEGCPYTLTLGSLRYEGGCGIIQANRDEYEVTLNVGNSDFYQFLKIAKLNHLGLGGDRDIADIMSLAHLATALMIDTDPEEAEFPVAIHCDTIDMDFTSSLTDNGHTFTAKGNATVTVSVAMSISQWHLGSLHLVIQKNSVDVINDSAYDGSAVDTDIVVTTGDVITIALEAVSEQYQGSYYVRMNIDGMTMEYSSGCLFETVKEQDQDTADFAIFPIENSEFMNNFPDDAFMLDNVSIKTLYSEYFPVLNYYKNGRFPMIVNGLKDEEMFSAANLFTPFPYLKYLVNKIATEAGYTLINTPFDYITEGQHPIGTFRNAVLFNAYAENTYTSGSPQLVPIKTTFNLVDHVPDMTQGEFFKQVCLLTGYMPVVDNQQLTITFVHLPDAKKTVNTFPGTVIVNPEVTVEPKYKGIKFELKNPGSDSFVSERIRQIHDKLVVKGSVSQLSQLPATNNTVNDMYLVTGLNEYYVWQYNPDTYALNWVYYSRNLQMTEEEGDDSKLEISSELHPVINSKRVDATLAAPSGGRTWKIPVTKQPGILEGFPIGHDTEWGFQFLIYVGLKTDSNDETYPLALSEKASYAGIDEIEHDMDARGIYAAHWRSWLEWLAYDAKPVKFYAYLTPAQLRNLVIHQPQRLPDGTVIMIDELNVNILSDRLSVAEITGYTC